MISHRYSDLEVSRTRRTSTSVATVSPATRAFEDGVGGLPHLFAKLHLTPKTNGHQLAGRCRTRSWKPSQSNIGGSMPWTMVWTKGVATLSLDLMLRDLEGEEERGERLSAPRLGLNRQNLKMHLDSMQLRCVILGARIREYEVYDGSRCNKWCGRCWKLGHSALILKMHPNSVHLGQSQWWVSLRCFQDYELCCFSEIKKHKLYQINIIRLIMKYFSIIN
jgi:hypothetical protein